MSGASTLKAVGEVVKRRLLGSATMQSLLGAPAITDIDKSPQTSSDLPMFVEQGDRVIKKPFLHPVRANDLECFPQNWLPGAARTLHWKIFGGDLLALLEDLKPLAFRARLGGVAVRGDPQHLSPGRIHRDPLASRILRHEDAHRQHAQQRIPLLQPLTHIVGQPLDLFLGACRLRNVARDFRCPHNSSRLVTDR